MIEQDENGFTFLTVDTQYRTIANAASTMQMSVGEFVSSAIDYYIKTFVEKPEAHHSAPTNGGNR